MVKDFGVSVARFFGGTVKRSWALVVGVLFGALGAVQTFNPNLLQGIEIPQWSWILGLVIVFMWSAALTYHELRIQHEKPQRALSKDDAYIKERTLQVGFGAIQPAVHSLNQALRAVEAVYLATWPTADDREIVSWGIKGRLVGTANLSSLSNAAAISLIPPNHLQEHFASGLFDYVIGRQMLNMVCRLFLTKDVLAGDLRYTDPQKRGCGELMRRWWEADTKLRFEVTALANDAHFAGIKGKLVGNLRDDPRFPNSNFTEALAKFWRQSTT